MGRNPDDGLAQGSGRGIPAFHLLEALESMGDLFVRFGGHKHAAGVTLEACRVDEFRDRFNARASALLAPEDFMPRLEIDAVVDLAELDEDAAAGVFALAPFGHGNPQPLFASLDVEVAAPPVVMKEKHLRLMVRRNGRTLTLKAWNFRRAVRRISPRRPCGRGFRSRGGRLLRRPRLPRLGRHPARRAAGVERHEDQRGAAAR